MNSLATPHTTEQKNQAVVNDRQPASKPSLDQIVKAICADARKNALRYALRSDTGQDGE
jgi:hypothetical protein